jgi:NADPH:quinone reductase-like Zn-dependent oxidoreductase
MAQEVVIKAIVQHRYGSPDVLELKDVDKPVARANEVLVRVQAAAVNIADWHLLRGIPYAMRPVGLLKPRHEIPGRDLAGRVEAVGGAVEQFRPGDEVFGWCDGAFAEYACAEENSLLAKPGNLTLEQAAAVGDSAFTASMPFVIKGEFSRGRRW